MGVVDPKTQAWIKQSLEPTFGYPSLARFSWATIKVVLEKDAHPVEWSVFLSNCAHTWLIGLQDG